MSRKIITIEGTAVPYMVANLDTDVIAPTEESLYVLSWKEAGDIFCKKERVNPDGAINKNHLLNNPTYAGGRILLLGPNAGCGSSREHAPQGAKARFDAIIAPSFAPIFADNCYAIGLPALVMEEGVLAGLADLAVRAPAERIIIDIAKGSLAIPGKGYNDITFQLDEGKREGFLKGTWDERARLTANLPRTREVLSRLDTYRLA